MDAELQADVSELERARTRMETAQAEFITARAAFIAVQERVLKRIGGYKPPAIADLNGKRTGLDDGPADSIIQTGKNGRRRHRDLLKLSLEFIRDHPGCDCDAIAAGVDTTSAYLRLHVLDRLRNERLAETPHVGAWELTPAGRVRLSDAV